MKRKSLIRFLVLLVIPVALVMLLVIVIDPFFHYHAPVKGLPYILSEERYQNDGIVKHFDYEAMITGSSTSQNFKASDIERLWGYETVKVPLAGSSYKEQDSIVRTAIANNPDLKLVIRGLDPDAINRDKDYMAYDEYPEYLYDDNPFNDADYIFNKDVMLQIVRNCMRLVKGKGSVSFDEYSNFDNAVPFGLQAVLSSFVRQEERDAVTPPFSDEDFTRMRENLTQNVIETAVNNPDIEFYLFFAPPCIFYWDSFVRTKSIDNVIDELKYTYELLLEVDNIKVYSFFDKIDITGNLDNYMDTIHYSGDICSRLCEFMKQGEGLITKENYEEYLSEIAQLYKNYDYDRYFE